MVAFGLFRRAVREPGFRTVVGAAPSSAPITPIGTFRKAICTYHGLGERAAIRGISLPSAYWRTDPRGKTLADNYRKSLGTYIALDRSDPRKTYDVGVKQPIAVAGEIVNVYIDALVYRSFAHTARIALWDVPQPTRAEASVMAFVVIAALEHAVGLERAHSVAFWHLRSGTVIEVDRRTARSKAASAGDAVRRAAGV